MINARAMQFVETTIDGKKERRVPGDVNLRQMGGGVWLANLSKGAAPSRPLKGRVGQAPTKGKPAVKPRVVAKPKGA